jgi:hypothetical protein
VQDSNSALETYQRQLRLLEEQPGRSDDFYVPSFTSSCLLHGLLMHVRQEQLDHLAIEERIAEQAETLRLTEMNATLSSHAAARRRCGGGARGDTCGKGRVGARAGTAARVYRGGQPRANGKRGLCVSSCALGKL